MNIKFNAKRIDLLDAHVFGFIIPMPTGIVWTTQVGGTYCGHPEIEGLLIPSEFHGYNPMSSSLPGIQDFYETDYEGYLKVAQAARALFLKETHEALNYLQELSKEEFECLPNSARVGAEAWVPFLLLGKKHHRMLPLELEAFECQIVIATWRNSD